jgi:predicted phosphate transport protein (TIGR00153 family)
MWLDKILTFLVPKDKKFFALFAKDAANLVEISKALVEFVNSHSVDKRQENLKRIIDLEHVGDNITHEIMTELSTNFITPFDREDIHYLATSIDDIADYIYSAAKKIELYKIEEISPAIKKLAELIERSCNEINVAVFDLRSLDNVVRIKEACVRINSLENHADDIYHGAIAELFDKETNAVKVIKHQDILIALETATDKCEDVANVIETILVKNS